MLDIKLKALHSNLQPLLKFYHARNAGSFVPPRKAYILTKGLYFNVKDPLTFLESGPKLNKKLLNLAKKYDKAPTVSEPETAEDFIEEGALDEESGDRWYSSDLSKGLRFYQKAYEKYWRAIKIGSSSSVSVSDQQAQGLAYYNASRLLFHVYSQYQKADGVSIAGLTGITEVLDARDESVVQNIQEIVRAHEAAIDFCNQDSPIDLLFNAAMVYMDMIEESEASTDTLSFASMSSDLLQLVLRKQVDVLEKSTRDNFAESNPDQVSQDISVSPSDVLETVIAVFNLAQTVLESVEDSSEEIQSATLFMGPFLNDADAIATSILNNTQVISDEQKAEYLIAKASATATSFTSMEEIIKVWDDEALPISAERSMTAADCIDSFLFRSKISSSATLNPELYWMALTKMNQYLKFAQDALSERLQLAKTSGVSNQQTGLGSIISQIAKVAIARSDIDLQRSQLPLEQAQKNQTLLFNNSKAFLKNAMNLAKQSGGIREKAIEKSQREKRRIEAVCRLCILERKTSVSELDSIVGAGRWQSEFETFNDLWYFPK